jgi:hypothetical protein
VSAAATLAHADRLVTPRPLPLRPAADVELAIEELASQVAALHGDRLSAVEAIARAATRLARAQRREARFEEERPVPAVGAWAHDQELMGHIVLGED